jgi:SAM-dependent methyltransferase
MAVKLQRPQNQPTATTNGGGHGVAPYSSLSGIYDKVVGNNAFQQIRATFEAAVRLYRIRFQSAADIGCGTGTFARYLTTYGILVFGVDRSQAMLDIAAQKNRSPNLVLLRQDIRRLLLPQTVDLITCNHDTLNYLLNASDLTKVFQRCRDHLSLDGFFIFDIIVALQDEQPRQRATQLMNSPTGCPAAEGIPKQSTVYSHWQSFWNPVARLSTVAISFIMRRTNGDYIRTRELHVQRWHSVSLIISLLEKTGFVLRGLHNAEDFGPVTNVTPWVKFVAQNANGTFSASLNRRTSL